MSRSNKIQQRTTKRTARTRKKLSERLLATHRKTMRPRLSVHRSNKYIYAQIIDDTKAKTLTTAIPKELESKTKTKTDQASKIGELIAKKAKDKKVTKVVFDKGPYKYHGRVKALAEAAKKGGLSF